MQTNCGNIYQNARKAAGITQERAAEMMGISVRSVADYEAGVRIPPNDVVEMMVLCYNSQLLAIQHLRLTSMARSILPEVEELRLPEAVLQLIDAIYDFADDKQDRELIDIARDGIISEEERPRFERIVEHINRIITAAMSINCIAPSRSAGGDMHYPRSAAIKMPTPCLAHMGSAEGSITNGSISE